MILYFSKEEKKKEIYIQLTTVYSNIIITGLGIHSFALLSFALFSFALRSITLCSLALRSFAQIAHIIERL